MTEALPMAGAPTNVNLMGDLESARVKTFDAGSTFVIPAGVWHVEWFESDTLVEISGIGPMRTERPPTTPRVP